MGAKCYFILGMTEGVFMPLWPPSAIRVTEDFIGQVFGEEFDEIYSRSGMMFAFGVVIWGIDVNLDEEPLGLECIGWSVVDKK